MRRAGMIFCLAVLQVLLTGFLFAQPVCFVSYMDGEVRLSRDENELAVDMGSKIELMDVITTGTDGVVELEFLPQTGYQGRLRMKPDTSLLVMVPDRPGVGLLELYVGTLSIVVKKASTQAGDLTVRSGSGVMGVRGTNFEVTELPEGGMLVMCEEGLVACQDEDGTEVFAEPGQLVERRFGERIRNQKVNLSEVAGFAVRWREERMREFGVDPSRIILQMSEVFKTMRGHFTEAFRELTGQRAIVDRWIQQDRLGRTSGERELAGELEALKPVITKLLKVLRKTDEFFRRFALLKSRAITAAGDVPISGMRMETFLARIENESAVMQRQIGFARMAIKSWSRRSKDALPVEIRTRPDAQSPRPRLFSTPEASPAPTRTRTRPNP